MALGPYCLRVKRAGLPFLSPNDRLGARGQMALSLSLLRDFNEIHSPGLPWDLAYPEGLLPPFSSLFPTPSWHILEPPPPEGRPTPLSPQVKRTLFINGISKYAESEKIKKHFE